MPCRSDYSEPRSCETESLRVIKFLKEVGEPYPEKYDRAYGNVDTIHEDTARLCAWCKTHDVSKKSLELQIWWRDHQAADARREAYEAEEAERSRLRNKALSKLTDAEKKALGIE